ncbi:MAG: glutamate formimidoyltransferase [Peptococcaceae bacterium]|nr:glutamate formimidoyltransferase [Peptococcaceae bacterium]
MRVVECVPNFSEGRRAGVIEKIVEVARNFPGIKLLDYSSDRDHNRTVVTFVGAPEPVVECAYAMTGEAARLIDLNCHSGGHPRMGAMDVVPFIPVSGVTMDECVDMARRLGERVGRELKIPVYYYEFAATRPERRSLAEVRKGEFEGLKTAVKTPGREPDEGPAELHPTAGAVAIGARRPLIAYNVNLNTPDVQLAKDIARAIRASGGGFVNVRAMGLLLKDRNVAQVSMNLLNYVDTPIYRVNEFIKSEAARRGVSILGTEIVGLLPVDALLDAAAHYLQVENFDRRQVLEIRMMEGPGHEGE